MTYRCKIVKTIEDIPQEHAEIYTHSFNEQNVSSFSFFSFT